MHELNIEEREKLEYVLESNYDLMIDRWDEYRKIYKDMPLNELRAKIQNEFDQEMDTFFTFRLLVRILKFWMDMDDDYYYVVASWILGTFFMDVFVSYPYLFINAVKRSGKTRLLKLIACLTNGHYTMSLKEAVLFRLPSIKKCGLCIDETEAISSREKGDLRELLNVAYKRGAKVFRTRKNPASERYVIDEFELFIPVAMANISGLDDVLADRCLSVILERSDGKKTKMMELFDKDEKITLFKYLMFDNSLVSLVHDDILKQYIYTYERLYDTIYTKSIYDTIVTKDIDYILEKGIFGRDLELWLPLILSKHVFTGKIEDIVFIAEKYVKERKMTDIMEDRDTSMLIFLAKFIATKTEGEWISYSEICHEFNENEGIDSKSKNAMNSYILTRILKRLKVVIDKRRLSTTRQIILNFDKIRSQIAKLGIVIDRTEAIDERHDDGLNEFIEKTEEEVEKDD